MKKTINKVFQYSLLVLAVVFLKACIEPEDLVTGNAKTGGLVIPLTANVPYKLNATPSISIDINIPKGPGVTSIEVHNLFTTVDGETSNDVVMSTLNIGGGNSSADVEQSFSVTYTELINGISVGGNPLPANEGDLNIGDFWTLSYVSVMEDGRKVVNNGATGIGVANQYAGSYRCTGTFFHPTAGPRPIDEDKFLTAVDAFTCYTDLGDLGSAGYDIYIKVNADNSCTVTVGPKAITDVFMTPGEVNAYDPATGEFELHYFYIGATGNRVIEEFYVPQ
ncbi:MAG TPA: DUF4361 domain-containing protein [Cyclobacteriaceae bacterium]|nr:DUF4361 domain-containing protein [Cyclobacteriaceae bacterium]